jgi:hypothetical protein
MTIIDSRAAELSGSGVSINMTPFDTQVPKNINDRDLSPGTKELPLEVMGATDMMFVSLRYELGTFLRRNMPQISAKVSTSKTSKDEEIDAFEQKLEHKYLRFCDALYPLHYLTSIVGRAAIGTIRLITHHPSQYPDGSASMSQEEKDMLFSLSMKLIKYDHLVHATPALSKFLWHIESKSAGADFQPSF